MDDKYYVNETDFRFAECVFYHMTEDKIITFDEYEKLRDSFWISTLHLSVSWKEVYHGKQENH